MTRIPLLGEPLENPERQVSPRAQQADSAGTWLGDQPQSPSSALGVCSPS